MKPNGMRAWRKAARRWRRKQNRRSGAPYTDGTGRWYRRQQAFFKQRPAAPSRPFTPRSLVGMTMGARKRKARYWMECERLHQKAQDLQEVVDRSVGRKSSLRTIGHTPISLRNHYRIGERLRPCPGCLQCQPKDCDGCGFNLGSSEDCESCEAHAAELYVMGCDGSGVLPAKG